MSELEYSQKMKELYKKMQEIMPGVCQAYDGVQDEVFHKGVFSEKIKRLMSLAVAVKIGCPGCIITQTEHALQLGASAEEILETCGVVISIGGTSAQANAFKVIQYLEEIKKI